MSFQIVPLLIQYVSLHEVIQLDPISVSMMHKILKSNSPLVSGMESVLNTFFQATANATANANTNATANATTNATTVEVESIKNVKEPSIHFTLQIHDIPHIFLAIKDMLNQNAKSILLTRADALQFVKTVLLILVESGSIQVENKHLVESMIQVSIDLLISTVNIQPMITDGCLPRWL